MEKLKPTPYVVSRERGRWLFMPSPTFTIGATAMFGAGSVFLIYLSTIFFRHADSDSTPLWIGAFCSLVAVGSAGLAIWSWRRRRTPLIIESTGHVSYADRELCPASSVRAVRIAEARGGEMGE